MISPGSRRDTHADTMFSVYVVWPENIVFGAALFFIFFLLSSLSSSLLLCMRWRYRNVYETVFMHHGDREKTRERFIKRAWRQQRRRRRGSINFACCLPCRDGERCVQLIRPGLD